MRWVLIFALIALVAAAFGFTRFSRGVAVVGRFVFGVFLALSVLFFAFVLIGLWEVDI